MPSFSTAETAKLQSQIYTKFYKVYELIIEERVARIPQNERNKDLVIIFAYQLLSEKHPTTYYIRTGKYLG